MLVLDKGKVYEKEFMINTKINGNTVWKMVANKDIANVFLKSWNTVEG